MQPPDLNKPDPSGQPPQQPFASSGSSQDPLPPPPPPYSGQQPPYGGPQPPYGGGPLQVPGAEKKLAAGLCGILLGYLGIHKFILGYNTEGVIMLLITVLTAWFTCGLSAAAMSVIGIIEGIIYLTKSDQQFVQEYVVNKKPWF